MGPKAPRSTVLTPADKAMAVAFRRHTLLPLDDCLYALQATIPHLTRSSLHRLFQRHDISRLPAIETDKSGKKVFTKYPIGYFHIDIAEVRAEEGKLYMLVAIDRTSKFVFVELHERVSRRTAAHLLRRLIEAVPYKTHTVLTDTAPTSRPPATAARPPRTSGSRWTPARSFGPMPLSWLALGPTSITGSPVDQRPGRVHEPHAQGRYGPQLPLR